MCPRKGASCMEWVIGAIVLYVAYVVIKVLASGAGRSTESRAAPRSRAPPPPGGAPLFSHGSLQL